METKDTRTTVFIPELVDWEVEPRKEFYVYEDGMVKARYDRLGMKDSPLQNFLIEKKHFKDRMADIVHHLNYFLTYFDTARESFLSILSIKYLIDTHPELPEKDFIRMMLTKVITPSFIRNCKAMSKHLYHVNVNTDPDGKFKNSPKITNAQAEQIVALSFCFRFILPLCIHYTNTGTCFLVADPKTGKVKRVSYLDCYSRLFGKILEKFEKDDVKVFTTICNFIVHRAEKTAQNNKVVFYQKEMIRGDCLELYIESIIHDVIIVKSLYKLDYTRSCVSFFDGIVYSYGAKYNNENYVSKPTEIDSPDTTKDSDDHPSHAEAIEMAVYKIDESDAMISNVNRHLCLRDMKPHFRTLGVDPESDEYKFYFDNIRYSEVSESLLYSFYTSRFKDPYAIYGLSKEDRVELQLYMKHFLSVRGMPLLAQICTATVRGKYKENPVKNARFIESITSDPVYKNILSSKFKYLAELDSKSDLLIRKVAAMLNCTFEIVDPDPEVNGVVLDDIDSEQLKREYLVFLSII